MENKKIDYKNTVKIGTLKGEESFIFATDEPTATLKRFVGNFGGVVTYSQRIGNGEVGSEYLECSENVEVVQFGKVVTLTAKGAKVIEKNEVWQFEEIPDLLHGTFNGYEVGGVGYRAFTARWGIAFVNYENIEKHD